MVRPLALADNAVFLAHARLRLRPPALLATFAFVALLLAAALIVAVAEHTPSAWTKYTWMHVGLAACVLVGQGAGRVGRAVSQARRDGLLDFHRASPTSAVDHALGYLLGAPIRELLVGALVCVPVAVGVLAGSLPARELLAIPVLVGTTAFACVLTLAFALSAGPRWSGGGVGWLLLVGGALLLAGRHEADIISLLSPVPALVSLFDDADAPGVSLLGAPRSPVVGPLVMQASVGLFAGWAALRRLRNPQAEALPRSGALVGLAWGLTLLVTGAGAAANALGCHDDDWAGNVAEGTFVALGSLLALTVGTLVLMVPTQLARERAARRAQHGGVGGLGMWAEGGSPWGLVPVAGGLLALATAGLLACTCADPSRPGLGIATVQAGAAVAVVLVLAVAIPTYLRAAWRGAEVSGGVLVGLVLGLLPSVATTVCALVIGYRDVPAFLSPLLMSPSPLYGLDLALDRFTGAWAGYRPESGLGWPLWLSLAFGAAEAAWFIRRGRRA